VKQKKLTGKNDVTFQGAPKRMPGVRHDAMEMIVQEMAFYFFF